MQQAIVPLLQLKFLGGKLAEMRTSVSVSPGNDSHLEPH